MAESASFGFRDVDVGDKQAMVDDVFSSVARRYDLMNDLMSGGMHRLWKGAMVSALNPPKKGGSWRLLDAAGGTGDIAFRIAERSGGHAEIVVADINPSMLAIGRERAEKLGCDRIGFSSDWNDHEYQFWQILPALKDGSGRLEHVAISGSGARLASRSPPFLPCAVLDVRDDSSGSLEVLGQRFEMAWRSASVRVLLPSSS